MNLIQSAALLGATVLALGAGTTWADEKTTHEQDKTNISNATRSDNSTFAKLDTNKNGYISKSEAGADAALAKDFDKFDLNHDGQLNRAEYLAARGKEDAVTVGSKVKSEVKGGKDNGESTTEGNGSK
jgi:hypothetical protein